MKIIGVDVGGTFTDVVLADLNTGRLAIHKVATTPDDPSRGVLDGIVDVCRLAGVDLGGLTHVFHGTTIATNAVLEYRGARTGMITTEGYRDIIHIGRHQRPQHYSIQQDIPWQARPLVRRRHRKTVRERLVPPRGEVLEPLDEEGVRVAATQLAGEGVESVAVCFLFSYLNPEHERRAAEIIRDVMPGAFVCSSAEVSAQFREFERFTTAAMNAFVGPVVRRYVERLTGGLASHGIGAELRIMRSNGGLANAATVSDFPVQTMLSGPAAGVMGGAWVAGLMGRRNVITFDVGGTSADIGIVTEQGISEASARDTSIAGYPLLVPMIDIHTIGAGGGSVAYVDEGGAFRVGPRSAGAEPGPACYGKGGDEPTVTDANLVLGRLDPEYFLGGRMPLYPDRAEAAVGRLAQQLGLSLEEAAEGVLTIVNHNMANAIHSRTVQKGYDPREFALVAFGGAGPLCAVEVARLLDVPEVIIPPSPGITSALGLLTTDLKYDLVQTEFMRSDAADTAKLHADFTRLAEQAIGHVEADGFRREQVRVERFADCRYIGQGYELRVAVPDGPVDHEAVDEVCTRFHDLHRAEYGHAFPDSPVELVNIRVVAGAPMPALPALRAAGTSPAGADEALLRTGSCVFRVDGVLKRVPTRFYDRGRLPAGAAIDGPAIIFQDDSTVVIPPDAAAVIDESGSLIIQVRAAGGGVRGDDVDVRTEVAGR